MGEEVWKFYGMSKNGARHLTYSKDVAIDKEWKINFNKPVDMSTVDSNVFIVDKATGERVETQAVLSKDGKSITLTHKEGSRFISKKTYILYINKDVKNTNDAKTLRSGVKMEFSVR